MSIKVKKFSWNPKEKEAKVEYLIETDGGTEKHVLECADQPMPQCLEAMQDLEYLCLHECEVIRVGDRKLNAAMDAVLGEGYAEKEHHGLLKKMGCPDAFATVRTVSWSWSHDIMGASVCLLIKLERSNSPLVVNTPHKPESQYNEGGTSPTLPSLLAEKLHALHGLVVRYIDGERYREQIDMFETQGE